jgi:TetR/AcrR family transcriptional repressor of mexJK operon
MKKNTSLTSRNKGRPTLEQAQQLKDNFLSVALDAFLQKGYAGTSIEGIARKAKVSKNTLYLHFKNKELLFKAAAEKGLEEVDLTLDEQLLIKKPVDEALLEIIVRIQEFAAIPRVQRLTRLLIAESQRFPRIAEDRFNYLKEMIKPIVDYLEILKKKKIITLSNAERAVFDLIILAMGGWAYLLSEPAETEVLSLKRAIEVRNLLLDGWRA